MRLSSRITVYFIFLYAFTCHITPAFAKVDPIWPHVNSDLAPESSISWGKLENGMRYVLMPNKEPPNRISIRLIVQAGSLMENDDQRGLAHFIEHMAFNGTKNFPAGEMVEYFQRLGMGFGADTNAYTSFNETVYMLELPNNDVKIISEGLRLLRDFSDGILFDEKEIEDERGVVISEKKARDSVEFRTYQSELSFIFPNSILPKRLPIGIEDVIKNADRKLFLDYYKKWYTADRLILIVTGDFEIRKCISSIEQNFSSFEKSSKIETDPNMGFVESSGLITKFHLEREASSTKVSIQTIKPISRKTETRDDRIKELYSSVATRIINRRLEKLSKKENSVFNNGYIYTSDFLHFANIGAIELTCTHDQWAAALKVAENELRRVIQYGFREDELTEIKAVMLNEFNQQTKTSATRKSRYLAQSIVSHIRENKVIMSPAQIQALAKNSLAKLTPKICHKLFNEIWSSENTAIFITSNKEINNPDSTIKNIYNESTQQILSPLVDEQLKAFAYYQIGDVGEIIKKEYFEDLAITRVIFSNNVVLNLKPTEYEANTIKVAAQFGYGKLTLPKNKPGMPALASLSLISGGLIEHSYDEIKRIFSGKTVSINFEVKDDALIFSGSTNQADIDDQLHLICAYLNAPGYRNESLQIAQKQYEIFNKKLEHTARGVLKNKVTKYLSDNDYRFGYPTSLEFDKLNLYDVKDWLDEQLKSSYLEVSIVGDFSTDEIIEKARSTLGALSQRQDKKQIFQNKRTLKFPNSDTEKIFVYQTEISKGIAAVYWPTTDLKNIHHSRRLNILSEVISDRLRLKIREEIGNAYSPYSANNPSSTYSDYGYLYCISIVDPSAIISVINIIRNIANDIVENGITEDELDRSLSPFMTSLNEQVRNNYYWLYTVLLQSNENPDRLHWARDMLDDYSSITVKDINNVATKYLKPANSLEIQIIPVEDWDDLK